MDWVPFLTREPTYLERAWSLATYPLHAVYHPIRALVSLPALSFFVIPAFSSYSTTLNFLFFYLTWAVLIKTHSPLAIEFFGTLAIRLVFFLLPSAAFLAFDSLLPDAAKGLKEHGQDALATSEELGGLRGRWWKITLVSVLNVVTGVLIQTGLDLVLTQVLQSKSAIKVSTSLPMPWSIVKDILLGLLVREILTYVLHRYVLHGQRSRLQKWHKRWQHSVQAPFSFVAHYDHPVAYLVQIFLPTYLPAVVLRMHLLTYQVYLILVSVEETFAHSGYNVLPTAFILGGIARRRERHLMGDGDGNFGCFGMADFLMGTSLGDDDLMDDVVDEAEEKQLGKRAKGKAKAVKNKARKKVPRHDDEDEGTAEETESRSSRSRSRRRLVGKKSAPNGREQEKAKPRSKPNDAQKIKARQRKRNSDDE